jgi:hypothetical protein
LRGGTHFSAGISKGLIEQVSFDAFPLKDAGASAALLPAPVSTNDSTQPRRRNRFEE